jgi:exopolysaccharide biosynthesis polyprenyl glycosylphosphotransferase
MYELRRKLLLNLMRLTDLTVMVIAFGFAFAIAGHDLHTEGLSEYLSVRIKLVNFVFFVAWMACWHVILKSFGLYRSQSKQSGVNSSEWWAMTKAVSLGTMVLSLAAVIFNMSAVNSVFLISFYLISLIGAIIARFLLRTFFAEAGRKGGTLKKLVIVGCGPRGAAFGTKVRQRPDFGYLLLGYIDDLPPPENPLHRQPEKILGPLTRTREILESLDVDEIVITLPIASRYQTIAEIISICEELAVDVLMPSDFFKFPLVNVAVDDSRAWPAMELRTRMQTTGGLVVKRCIDFVVSLAAMVFLSPLFAFIALAIKLDSRGPVFFRQTRVGFKRKTFKMHKFRTMFVDAEDRITELESLNEVSGAAFKMTHDPRVTRVGRTLRRLSLDELPQFIDVLRGDMSLVGPRPLPIRDVERFEDSWQKRRFSAKPGLTCLWQVNGRHNIEFEHWMELDLEYVDNWSLSLDVDIMLKTIPAVLRGNGAS